MAAQPPSNILSGPSLSKYMSASFPKDASPQLKNAYDTIALAAHACMLSIGARLVGLGEDHRIEAHSEPDKPQPLPSEWNAQTGSYAFRYKHGQSSMEFLLKISRMGNKAVVMGMGMGDDRTCSFDVKVQDYVSESNLPLSLPSGESFSQEEAEKKVVDVFITIGRLSDFGVLMRLNIIQKLLPALQKEGYEETLSSNAASTSREPPGRERDRDVPRHDPLREDRDPPARPYPLHDPLAVPHPPRRGPVPEPIPGFEDEFEFQRPPRGMPGGLGGGGFGRIGERDLYPQGLGPNDPIRGGIGPGLGGGMGGGMHPSFDDPLFAGQGQGGQQGYDPRNPPGSRFDPVGPGLGGGGGHPRGAGMGGRPPNPFGGSGSDDFI